MPSPAAPPPALTPRRAGGGLEDSRAAGLQNCLQRFDPIIGRLEEEVFEHRLGALKLPHERLRLRLGWHRPAVLRERAIADRLSQDSYATTLSMLEEVG